MSDYGPVYDLVNTGVRDAQGYAGAAFGEAMGLIGTLAQFNVDAVQVNADFTPPELSTPFRRPDRPELPTLAFTDTFKDPGDPVWKEIAPFVPDPAPADFTGTPPALDFGGKPDPFTGTFDAPAPTITDRTVPASNIPANPDVPTLYAITLPDIPVSVMPTFSSTAPVFAETAPDGHFIWSESAYSDAMVTALQSKILGIMSGGSGLPAAVEQALWDRARVREDIVAEKAVMDATEEFAARGFSLPPGALSKRIIEVRQDNAFKVSSLSRDIYIKATDVQLDQLKFAVSQGVALEQILANIAMQIAQRAFEAAKYTIESAIALFNAKVVLFNTRLESYKTDASVYKTLIEAEIAKLERYKVQIEGQRVIGELNTQLVELYKAKFQGVMAAVEVYKAQVQAVVAQIEVDKGRIDVYRGQIEAFKTRVEAKGAEFSAWATEITVEGKKADAYAASVGAYASRVQAYSAVQDAKAKNTMIGIEENKLYVQEFLAKVEYLKEQIAAETARISAGVMAFDAGAKLYSADGEMERARVASDAQLVQMKVEEGKIDAETDLKKAELNISQVQREAQLVVQALEGAARASAQLTASALSAVHLGAQVQATGSQSDSTSHSYQEVHTYKEK